MRREVSEKLFVESRQYFPGGVNSPVRAFKSVGGVPVFIEKGKGAFIWDADGNRYMDFCASWGPLILGHAPDVVVEAVIKQCQKGTSFGAPTAAENDLAGLILHHNRYIQKLRFVSSGTEAVMSAIRLARAFTGKNKILKFEGCYHGHSDALLVKAGSGLVTFGSSSSSGVPESFTRETIVVPLNEISAIDQAFEIYGEDLACVIIEPLPANNGLLIQTPEFLQYLRNKCNTHGALLIFDEVISGFRLGFEGAAGCYNIAPDIITYGKIIGGGFPVGAYGASNEIMSRVAPDGDMYQAGTLSGNPVAMRAGFAQLQACLSTGFYDELLTAAKRFTYRILSEVEGKLSFPFQIFSMGSVFWFAFSAKQEIRRADEIDPESMRFFRTLHGLLLREGIYLGPSGYEVGFISAAHTTSDLDEAAAIISSCLLEMSDKLSG